jgi:DNA-directed RNA polymerase subunit RPC12/RpoP
MISFFCTRCGTRLQIDDDLGGQSVRCGHCDAALRSPEVADDIPIAQVAEEVLVADFAPEPVPVLPLDYIRAWRPPPRFRIGDSLEVLAERLERVEPPDPQDASAMTNCPHCGSTIASFVGRCPFCRHPLRGS